MVRSVFNKAILVSFLGHLAVFTIFGFSFSKIMPKADYPSISFWGQFLEKSQVIKPDINEIPVKEGSFFEEPNALTLAKEHRNLRCDFGYYFLARVGPDIQLRDWQYKPSASLSFDNEKETYIAKPVLPLPPSHRGEPAIIFHPLLPLGFSLYFNDRQVAHVELMFKITSFGLRSPILIKRKISSGNLEVDLLSMRYIGHYLFIQQKNFNPDSWQIVKIDLSAKND